jgi:hypothetical protein
MADFPAQILAFMVQTLGPDRPLHAALQHMGRGIPRQAKVELTQRFGRDIPIGEALEQLRAARA